MLDFGVRSAAAGGGGEALEPQQWTPTVRNGPGALRPQGSAVAPRALWPQRPNLQPYRAGAGARAVSGPPEGTAFADEARGAQEGPGRRAVRCLTEADVPARARVSEGPRHVLPLAVDLEEGLVDMPASPPLSIAVFAQAVGQPGSERGFPLPHGLVGEDQAALQEQLGQLAPPHFIA
jgi:hypothetical protein